MSVEDEAALIRTSVETIKEKEGAPPTGWLSPAFSESLNTIDLLAVCVFVFGFRCVVLMCWLRVCYQDAGLEYVMDWASDDQPFWVYGKEGDARKQLLNIPCSHDVGDMPAVLAHDASPSTYAQMLIDAFDELRRQAKGNPQQLVYSLPLRTFKLVAGVACVGYTCACLYD